MKKVAIVTLFPEMFDALTQYGVTGRAVKQDLISLYFTNPREFTKDRHQTVDERPYGGGPGMVMKIEPLKAAIDDAKAWLGAGSSKVKVIYLSPQGQLFKQQAAKRFVSEADYNHLILIAGRYEGIDERLLSAEVDEEWSIGDYVLSGGELPAMVLLDSIIRLLPGALGHSDSAEQDSFSQGLLDCPHYTRPEVYEGQRVPEVLLAGNHKAIAEWRHQQAVERTRKRRPDLLKDLRENKLKNSGLAATKAGENID